MPSRLTGFVCPTVSMVTTGHATGVEKTITGRGGGVMCRFTPTKGEGGGQVLAMLKEGGGGHNKFWGSFYPVA